MFSIWFILCLILLFFSIVINKDIANPVFVSGGVWFAVYIIMFFTNYEQVNEDIYYGCFFCAFLFFFIGFYIATPRYKVGREKITFDVEWNKKFGNSIILFEYVFISYIVLTSISYIGTRSSIWTSMRSRNLLGIEALLFNFIPIAFFVALGWFLGNPTERNKKYMILTIPPLLIELLFENRGGWFFVLITIVFMVIYIKRYRNNKIIKYAIVGICIILVAFIGSSIDKYSNSWLEMRANDKLIMILEMYFVNPAIAFVDWLHTEPAWQYGKYTFRFFCALLNPIFPTIEVVDTVQGFVETNGAIGNVFTSLQWYTYDFGIGWAFIIHLILGAFFGVLYKRIRNKEQTTLFTIILLSMLMYTIANQFFSETLFTVLSMWIQRIFWLFLLTRPKFCVHRTVEDEVKRKRRKIRIVWRR